MTLTTRALTNGFEFDSTGDLPPGKSASRPVSRVLSGALPPVDDHSSGTPVAGRFTQPTRMTGPETALKPEGPASSLFGLAPGGVCPAAAVAGSAVRSCRTISPLRRDFARARYHFCGTFPRVAPAGRYPAPCSHGARTFLPRTLSGIAAAVIQPAGGSGGRPMGGQGQPVITGRRDRAGESTAPPAEALAP